jgi:hypothetical protein
MSSGPARLRRGRPRVGLPSTTGFQPVNAVNWQLTASATCQFAWRQQSTGSRKHFRNGPIFRGGRAPKRDGPKKSSLDFAWRSFDNGTHIVGLGP